MTAGQRYCADAAAMIAEVIGNAAIANEGLTCGEPGGDRTRNHRLKRAMLYQLSYRPELWEDAENVTGLQFTKPRAQAPSRASDYTCRYGSQ